MIDSVFKLSKNYYPEVFLEECKYIVKEKRISHYISDELEISSDDSEKGPFDIYTVASFLMGWLP